MQERHGFQAKVIADSVGEGGVRLTTMQLRYPRFIHSEFMTHRVFSRNAASSRAIPIAKMIEQVRNDPATPVFWGKNQAGMQAVEELDDVNMFTPWGTTDRQQARNLWVAAAEKAAASAESMMHVGTHKQIVNRLLEPWQWMQTIVTATEWDNFFALRCHPDAQPEMQLLATLMRTAREQSPSHELATGEWHLPYVSAQERKVLTLNEAVKCSVARCARVSYLTHDGESPDLEKDIALHDRLVGSWPIHASPAEHQATPDRVEFADGSSWVEWAAENLHGNLKGWIQYRKVLEYGLPIELRLKKEVA